jgi:two-component system nitrogen regulation response regulator GlnG
MTFGGLSTRSSRMKRLFEALAAIAATDLNLVVEGETGVGKEVVAEAVHRVSPRARAPFLVFDCAARSPVLAEWELFGDEQAPILDATQPIPAEPPSGLIEQANHGTLMLDHVEALAPHLQRRLLRALESNQSKRANATRGLEVDLRIIAVTSRNLLRDAQRGAFRYDLYLALSGARVRVPPLRQRMEDLPLLVDSLLAEFRPVRSRDAIPDELWQRFERSPWRGNIRELRNTLERVHLAEPTTSSPRAT